MILKTLLKLSLLIGTSLLITTASVSALSNTTHSNYLGASTTQSEACATLGQLNSNQGCGTSNNSFTGVISDVVNILSLAVGAIAVVMIIVSGFKYITSGGDSNKVGSAKNTLIYSLIGVVVAAFAQILVHFVLYNSNHAISALPRLINFWT